MKIANFVLLLSLMIATSAGKWRIFGTNGSHNQEKFLQSSNATKPSHGQKSEETVLSSNITRRVSLADTELVLAFVVLRHGDRTPSKSELSFLKSEHANWTKVLFPYGYLALTNKGKLRSYYTGKYLRERYDGFISRMYLPDEIEVRSTDYARSKMAVLAVLAAMYSPTKEQKWVQNLNWLPIPYSTLNVKDDDMVFWSNCPKFFVLRNHEYEKPVVKKMIQSHKKTFEELSKRTHVNVSTPFQKNVKYPIPKWGEVLMPAIETLAKIECIAQTGNNELLKLSIGLLLNEIMNASNAAVFGKILLPKLRIYSGHAINVAAILGAAGIEMEHQPPYGSAFSLELRTHRRTGEYGMAAIYADEAGKPGIALPIEGCSGALICEYATFQAITKDILMSKNKYKTACHV